MIYSRNMMSKSIFFVVFILCLFFSAYTFAKEGTSSLFFEKEVIDVQYRLKKSRRTRARAKITLNKVETYDGIVYFRLVHQGSGNYDNYKDITWVKSAKMLEENGILKTTNTTMDIYDQKNRLLKKYQKSYNYQAKTIRFQITNEAGQVIRSEVFPIKGPTCDDVTLVHFLRTFVANRDQKKFKSFYLLTNEPRLYKVNIKNLGKEVLKLPIGDVDTIKLQLKADGGSLTAVASRLVVPTYVWYAQDKPYEWLQYEGLEIGLKSAHIRVFTTKRSPSLGDN